MHHAAAVEADQLPLLDVTSDKQTIPGISARVHVLNLCAPHLDLSSIAYFFYFYIDIIVPKTQFNLSDHIMLTLNDLPRLCSSQRDPPVWEEVHNCKSMEASISALVS